MKLDEVKAHKLRRTKSVPGIWATL